MSTVDHMIARSLPHSTQHPATCTPTNTEVCILSPYFLFIYVYECQVTRYHDKTIAGTITSRSGYFDGVQVGTKLQ